MASVDYLQRNEDLLVRKIGVGLETKSHTSRRIHLSGGGEMVTQVYHLAPDKLVS
jgi:hypothetical protein